MGETVGAGGRMAPGGGKLGWGGKGKGRRMLIRC